jgi:3-oxoacyl-[acyl-carrier-protein] synthase II
MPVAARLVRRVVITGVGAVTPLGLSATSSWEAARRGVSGAGPITRFDASRHDTRFACELKGFDPLQYVDRKLARRMDVFAQYAMAAANEAIAHAGLDTTTLTDAQRARIGVMIGSGQGGMETFQQQAITWHEHGPGRLSPFFVPMIICDIAGAWVAMQHGLRGPNHCVVSACATGNDNLMSALDSIRAGRADIILAGGAECAITPLGVGGFGAARALSTRNDDPAAASRPFDTGRDGFVLGEGAGVLVLEALEHAEARGATILGELLAVGAACDAHHLTAPHPDGVGARLAMEGAFAEARLTPADVDTINMHATSTGLGDVAECRAVRAVFGEHADRATATATKSMTGHMLGAAGAVEAIFSVQSILHDIVPPVINLQVHDPACDVRMAANVAEPRPVRVAISNAFGFGGHNTCAIFAERAVGDALA